MSECFVRLIKDRLRSYVCHGTIFATMCDISSAISSFSRATSCTDRFVLDLQMNYSETLFQANCSQISSRYYKSSFVPDLTSCKIRIVSSKLGARSLFLFNKKF